MKQIIALVLVVTLLSFLTVPTCFGTTDEASAKETEKKPSIIKDIIINTIITLILWRVVIAIIRLSQAPKKQVVKTKKEQK
ncbi:hypothetical protein [Guggenheimella bovis]